MTTSTTAATAYTFFDRGAAFENSIHCVLNAAYRHAHTDNLHIMKQHKKKPQRELYFNHGKREAACDRVKKRTAVTNAQEEEQKK